MVKIKRKTSKRATPADKAVFAAALKGLTNGIRGPFDDVQVQLKRIEKKLDALVFETRIQAQIKEVSLQ
jgi:hypothetical protein